MQALFTTARNLEITNAFKPKRTLQLGLFKKTLWSFLTKAFYCLPWVNSGSRPVNNSAVCNKPFKSKLAQEGQISYLVNSVAIDSHYHLPGASPPFYECNSLSLYKLTPNITSIKTFTSQIMSKLSIPLPLDRHRVLRARFDEKSERWVSTSPPYEERAVSNTGIHKNIAVSPKTLMNSLASTVGIFVVLMLTVFSALGQQAPKVVDIKLSKTISNAQPTLNQSITYTVYAKNEGPDTAKTVVVKDIFPTAGANLISSTPSVGSFSAGLWTIPVISPGDSVKLEMTGTVIGRGVYFNIAEVVSMAAGQEDADSDPNNGVLGEDDYATSCFSVPILWYPGDEYVVSLAVSGYTNVVWTKNGAPITGVPSDSSSVSGDTLIIKGTGRFAFSAQVNTCPATGCCEIIVIPGPLGSIGDFVWKDVNDNGIQDSGEPGVNQVLVRLFQKDDLGVFVQTDSTLTAGAGSNAGKYLFSNLYPGEYKVQFVSTTLPTGCLLSSKQDVGSDSLDSDAHPTTGFSQVVTINPEMGGLLKDNPTIDAGLYSPLGSIGDFVWKDTDNDGIQDAGEAGINNVLVRLYKNVSNVFVQVDSMYTTANPVGSAPGWYTFEGLSLGEYKIQIVKSSLPNGCVLSDSTNKGGDDTKDSDFDPTTGFSQVVSIDPTKSGLNKNNPTIDGALYSPLGSIGDFVWKDLNDNGQQDVAEPGVKNVRVILWTSSGTTPITAIDTTFTDVNGYYSFTNLVGGTYQVQFDTQSLPDTCQLSLNQNVGSDVTDSDANPISGLTAAIVIDPTKSGINKDNLTVDAALTTFDLSLTKSLASGQSGNVAAGDNVTFTLTVKNEGSMTATAIA
ncbi:DUF11 domain-containing protein, partial [Runella sp. CRIBMP]|uniref:SdrD B-like domain-containing protein n=1 Tax=Runella sp. CRIBMP TaxID=2683261 RepID=UPI001411B3DA